MCHSDSSRPPVPPSVSEVAEAGDLHLTSADGTQFMAYEALPTEPNGKGVVILPDLRGLHEFYKDFARRLAETGFAAIAIDYFGRSLPDGPRNGAPEEMFPLVMQLTPEVVAADVRAATDRQLARGGSPTVYSLGFCFGGSQSWSQSAFDERLTGCIGFYGRPDDCRPLVERMQVPLLLLVGSEDFLTPVDDFHRFAAELGEAGVEHTMVVYEGAPHAFFDGGLGFDEECADAWQQVLRFTDAPAAALDGTQQ